MNYRLVKDIIDLMGEFDVENENSKLHESEIIGLKNWIVNKYVHTYIYR